MKNVQIYKKKLRVRVEMRFSNFAIKYLRENENVRETVFACSYGAQVDFFWWMRPWNKTDFIILKVQTLDR